MPGSRLGIIFRGTSGPRDPEKDKGVGAARPLRGWGGGVCPRDPTDPFHVGRGTEAVLEDVLLREGVAFSALLIRAPREGAGRPSANPCSSTSTVASSARRVLGGSSLCLGTVLLLQSPAMKAGHLPTQTEIPSPSHITHFPAEERLKLQTPSRVH